MRKGWQPDSRENIGTVLSRSPFLARVWKRSLREEKYNKNRKE